MKRVFRLMLLLGPAVVVLGRGVGSSVDDVQAAAPPLSLEGYLDEKLPEAKKADAESLVDNSACYVCHGNYDGEELVLSHAKEEIGCVDCHGQSVEHRNDEANVTPPDTMYALADVDRMCGDCHPDHDVPAREVIERWRERGPAKTAAKDIVCTDCHYQHRLRFRTVAWDKKTGRLLLQKGGESVKQDLGETKPPQEEP